MSDLKTPSARPRRKAKIAPTTLGWRWFLVAPEKRYEREKSLAHLLIIAHDEGEDVAMKEWRRMLAEKRTDARSSPGA